MTGRTSAQERGSGVEGKGAPVAGRDGRGVPLGDRALLASGEKLAIGLAAFGIGLGAAEVLAPRLLSRLLGVEPRPWLVRAMGGREIAASAAILARPRSSAGLWARLAGDAVDLALLGAGFFGGASGRKRLALAGAAVLGVTALDAIGARSLLRIPPRPEPEVARAFRVRRSVTIARSPEEAYGVWRDLPSTPRFMTHLETVAVLDDRRSRWVAKGPAGARISWESELIEDVPGKRIAWRSVPGSTVESSGAVDFEPAPAGRGTVVRVDMAYRTPAGAVGALAAKLFGEAPEQHLTQSLRNFQHLLEAGELPTTDGQPTGKGAC